MIKQYIIYKNKIVQLHLQILGQLHKQINQELHYKHIYFNNKIVLNKKQVVMKDNNKDLNWLLILQDNKQELSQLQLKDKDNK